MRAGEVHHWRRDDSIPLLRLPFFRSIEWINSFSSQSFVAVSGSRRCGGEAKKTKKAGHAFFRYRAEKKIRPRCRERGK